MCEMNLNENKEILKVTSIEDMRQYAQGSIVRLPDFAEGQPFVAKLRRPSMLMLAKSGNIPNGLMEIANEMFMGGGENIDIKDEQMLKNVYELCEVIINASLVEPTLSDIKNAGLELSDDQIMAIFNYSQTGIDALKPFLQE